MKLKELLFVALVMPTPFGWAQSPESIQKTPGGLVTRLGQARVELSAVNTNTFRLAVTVNGVPEISSSTFLVDTTNALFSGWREVSRRGMVGVETAAGQLLINPRDGRWTLEDAGGRTLIPRHLLGSFTASDSGSVELDLGWKAYKPLCVYGCGNGTNTLEQSQAKTRVGNGVAVIPYFWSSSGYSVLAVTADDNHPARWRAGPDGQSVTWTFPGAAADLYLMPSATLKDAAKNYARLTGYAPVPPRWAFGYLQSRWGWVNREYIGQTLDKFQQLRLPVDAFIFDFEWYTPTPDYT
ncbi:MAG: TIM-barrel domain-containing protein, partial [Limisphaerales bacterium]